MQVAVALVCAFRAGDVAAQARDAATRAAEISGFGEFESLSPDYGEARDKGIIFGVDFTRLYRTRVQPSLEVRYAYAGDGATVGEHVALIGGRADLRLRSLGRVRPYANFLVGAGTITFTNPIGNYLSDTSTVLNYGGGVAYDLPRHFSLQGEFEMQHWKLGNANSPLTPSLIGIGVQYHIPFGRRR